MSYTHNHIISHLIFSIDSLSVHVEKFKTTLLNSVCVANYFAVQSCKYVGHCGKIMFVFYSVTQ